MTALQPKLKEAQAETNAAIVQIEKESVGANKQKEEVAKVEATCSAQLADAQKIKDECEHELAVAKPALANALAALDTLTQKDISELKQFKVAKGGVKLTFECICILFGEKPARVNNPDGPGKILDYWSTTKKKVRAAQ